MMRGAFVGEGQIVNTAGKVTYYKRPGALTFEEMCCWLDGGDFMQRSCFFRRSAWEAAGPLDERIHIALEVDLWLRMVRLVKFRGIDRLLSTSLTHKHAKTQAYRNEIVVDAAIVIIPAGGHEAVRQRLVSAVAASVRREQRRLRNRVPIVVLRRGLRLLRDWRCGAPAVQSVAEQAMFLAVNDAPSTRDSKTGEALEE